MRSPPPLGPDIRVWANQIVLYLRSTAAQLTFKTPKMTPATNGSLVWDEVLQCPVVSINGVWVKLKLDP